jgi:Tfp pilus assembly protein PilN
VRPVNLIPPEQRRGGTAPMRTGPLSYVVVALLAVALGAVTLVVVTNNQVSDRKAEKTALESQLAEEQAAADRVQSFATFASVQQAREQTVSTLAQSRFDWERVLRELAIVIPDDVWVTNLTAAVSPDAVTGSSSTSSSSSTSATVEGIAGPSLEIQGCAGGHEAVARFLAAVHDIDGVTRASVTSSERPDQAATSAGAASAGGAQSQECSSRNFVSKFDLTMAFDAVQLGAAAASSATAPATPATTTTTSTTSSPQPTGSGSSASTGEQGQVSDANQQLQQQKDSAAQKTEQGRNAVSTFIPGTGSGR